MSAVKNDDSGSSRRPYHSTKRAQAALEPRRRRMRASAREAIHAHARTDDNAEHRRRGPRGRGPYLGYPSKAALLMR